MLLRFLCIFLALTAYLSADVTEDLLHGVLVEGVTVNIQNPTLCEGVLTTEQGGVIEAPGIRIQARKINYTRKVIEQVPICKIQAEEEVMLEFGDYIFVGERLEYDFQTASGALYCARAGVAPWFAGGQVIYLNADGSYEIESGFFTTSENYCPDWAVSIENATLEEERYLQAKGVRIRLFNWTLLWLPSLNTDLQKVSDHPVDYKVGWGGDQGPRISLSYQLFSWNRWKTFIRLGYRLKRGLGGGFETKYYSEDHREYFDTLNYIAHDSSIFLPHERLRYRFQGTYSNLLMNDKVSVEMNYDKLSDKDMATDYADQGLELEDAERTQLEIRRQEENWISSLYSRIRVNSFETVKQELPTCQLSWRPFVLGNSGIISDTRTKAAYLDFEYTSGLPHVHDYNSTRLSASQRFYRPFSWGPITATPELGGEAIFYGNSPTGGDRWVGVGIFGCDLNTSMYQMFNSHKHVIVPYVKGRFYTFPITNPNKHYIFDIEDGWARLNVTRFGVQQNFYSQDFRGCMRRYLSVDLYANAFFDIHTIPYQIPRAYASFVLYPSSILKHHVDIAWNFQEKQLDYANFRSAWTFSPDFAIAAEYRHRSSYDWRKVDRDNFMLDAFRSVRELRHSALSDRRSTALLHFFYRFHPNWAMEYEARHGWDRRNGARYNEFECALLATLRSAIQLRLSYQHRESEDRVAIDFTVGVQRPERLRPEDLIPYLEF